jgi:hypothetical protein
MHCHCFDLCTSSGAELYLRQTGALSPGKPLSPAWQGYLRAVYGPGPLRLGQSPSTLSFVYLNSKAWRGRHPHQPSPFRDCTDASQRPCRSCSHWTQDEPESPRSVRVGLWPCPWLSLHPDTGASNSSKQPGSLLGMHLYAAGRSDGFGHDVQMSDGWLEVMRERVSLPHGRSAEVATCDEHSRAPFGRATYGAVGCCASQHTHIRIHVHLHSGSRASVAR